MAAALLTKLHSTASLLFISLLVFAVLGHKSQNLLSCETTSPDASGYHCTSAGTNGSSLENQCRTFAILRTNSYYSSLFNLSAYLGINRFVIAEANGFSADTEFLPKDEPLLIPIDCKCSSNGGLFHAELTKTTIKGESFYGIAKALEGLTTCKAIREKNRGVSPWALADKLQLLIPLRCACPSSSSQSRLLLSYPVSEGSWVTLGPLAKPREPNLRFPATSIPAISPHKKKPKMHKIGLYVALSGVIIGSSIAIAAAFLLIQLKKKKQGSPKGGDVELQQLSLSVRTTSDKKVSFEGSQETLDGQIIDTTTPRKVLVETYSIEELRRATTFASLGRRPVSLKFNTSVNHSPPLKSDNADELREWMDSGLGENYSFDAAVMLSNLARACVDEDPCLRPSAGEIVEKLSRLVEESLSQEGENILISESSCKPLVKAAVKTNSNM
ncbi:protein LYK2-like [Prunus avium]|uniref:Protein LYK2-like n=1 Tax=Prunus avium TaxID=42229 RepID=A0A6P5T7C9_PRUAV|nr:protein LYK2-like [Prunus avium]